MGMSAGAGRGGIKSDINVTPLVDVVLVLLIIFMVVTPLMKRGRDVTLPKASQPEEKSAEEPLFLSMTADRKLYVEEDVYPDEAAFLARLQTELRKTPGRRLLLKADQSLTYGDIGRIVQKVRVAGVGQVALGVEVVERP